MNILFNKVRDVKSPNRAYGTGDAADFFVPEYSNSFLTDLEAKNPNKAHYECSVSSNLDSMTITLAPHGSHQAFVLLSVILILVCSL